MRFPEPRAGSLWAFGAMRDLLGDSAGSFDPEPSIYGCGWDDVVAAVRDHRVAQVLVNAPWFDGLAEQARNQISEIALVEIAHAMKLCADTEEVSTLLARAGLRHLILKGVTLAFIQGRPLTGRGSGDVDVWVHPHDLAATQAALIGAGWSKHQGVTSHLEPSDKWRWRLLQAVGSERSFGRYGHCDVDLHWRSVPIERVFDLSFTEAWEESVRVGGLSGDIRTLCPRDALRHVVAHGLKDGWATLRDILDVVYCARVIVPEELTVLAQCDPNVALALATVSRIDPVIARGHRITRRRRRLANEGLAGCLGLGNRGSVREGLTGAEKIRMRWSRASWSMRTQESALYGIRSAVVELMPLRLILRHRTSTS